jgi:hypothetical protein
MADGRRLIPRIVPGDWNGVAWAIAHLDRRLNTGASPIFAGLDVTGNVDVTGGVVIGGTLEVAGAVTIAGGLTLGGDLNMQCNEIQNFLVHIVADDTAMRALSCGQGQMCFRQDTDKFYGRLT